MVTVSAWGPNLEDAAYVPCRGVQPYSFYMQDLGFRVKDLGLSVKDLGLRVKGFGA